MYSIVPIRDTNTKLYTQKELVLIETSITEFHYKLYVPEKLEFRFPYVRILGNQ